MSPFVEPYIPEPREPLGRRTGRRVMYWLERIFRSDVAVGPAEVAAVFLIFFLTGWSVGGVAGEILRPSSKFLFQLRGAIVGLILVKPALGFRTPRGYLGIASAGLLAILILVGSGAVGKMAAMSKQMAAAVTMEYGNPDAAATAASDYCIKEESYKLGLLTREETDRLCGYKTEVREEDGVEKTVVRYSEVPKPSFLAYVWELVKLVAVAAVLILLFKKP